MDGFNATNFYTEHLLGLWVAQDLDDPAHYSPFMLQGGLGMPDRSYYLDSSPAMATIRDKYKPHIAAMLGLAKIPDAQAKADAIMRLETKIATAHLSREVSGDVTKANNHWTRAEFGTKAPGLDWETYFAAAGLGKPARFVVWQPSAVTGISALTASEPLDVWKSYLTFHALNDHARLCSRAVRRRVVRLLRAGVERSQKQRDRWRRAIVATNNALGFAVGRR